MIKKIKNLWTWQNLLQILVLALVACLIWVVFGNVSRNLQKLGLKLGFDFLNSQASFNIREMSIAYESSDTYGRALTVGLLNTFKVMAIAIVSATILGVTVGVAKLSDNWLVRNISSGYVEVIRNTPLLLQLFFWYFVVFLNLPPANQHLDLLFGGLQLTRENIRLLSFNFYPEFCALVIGLTIYQGSFIAEIVRGSILAIPQGQWEAARAMGLSGGQVMQLVIFPQALRIIMPPLTSQYLNIAKNSSLAVAIAYEDIYAIASTTFNQTGRSIEVVLLLMVTYLSISLLIALGMNFYQRSINWERTARLVAELEKP
jgi:general L-amino acid transport system permease protein